MCQLLGADTYYNTIAGEHLYDADEFKQNGIELKFVEAGLTPYVQFKNEFVPGLSMIDALMFNSKEQVCKLLDAYTLV